METKYLYDASVNVVKEFIKEMKNFTREELEGVKKCIENDSSVTRKVKYRNSFKLTIHDNEAICVYMLASYMLENK